MADWKRLAEEHPRYRRLAERYGQPRPRKLLALDGGGIRGVMTLEILAELERQLKRETGGGDDFRLCDYFDYIGGTSTGAIIAAGLALGFSVEKLLGFYLESGKAMFTKPFFLKQLWYKFQSLPLTEKLKDTFGQDDDGKETRLGSERLRCLLLIVARNVTTDSPWPVSSNPFAMYNRPDRPDCNLNIPLYRLVRASTAAPTFFSPETITLNPENPNGSTFKFEDGGVTPYNNPAFLLYRMAVGEPYNLAWEKGEKNLLLVSIGTGVSPRLDAKVYSQGNFILSNAAAIPAALMFGAQVDQDINCRFVGRCVHGDPIDRELGGLIPLGADPSLKPELLPLSVDLGRSFLYARYNVELTGKALDKLGLSDVDPKKVAQLDSVEHIDDLRRIGRKVAEEVDVSKFGPFV